ncbi:response regulator receiver domain protein [Leptospira fainei serovar Hurstbridge str. BUT 6]|uniref:Response regulator receiver domain protein n=1 Tax=Leptospira fainei serovar Hurstbridge str. BUT 6 TaxID=1193011 RepID=S3V282_9LEPT|nr:response regulator [Leptospira fainei]EPG75498.1 response regulator receiver domain protein [Leptospira fainei serovar Hurstbridge str. BUT 6]
MGTVRILAVDDSATMRSLVQQTLGMGGYDVLLASDGKEGIEKFGEGPFDLVITDINMPVMDGITFIRELRKIDTKVPILTLTTESEESMKQNGAAAGANGWIVKPFRPIQFLDIIKQVLQSNIA